VKVNYDPAMRIVAFAELFLLGRLILGAVTWVLSPDSFPVFDPGLLACYPALPFPLPTQSPF